MDDLEGEPVGSPGLVDRAKGILLNPNGEWPRIDVEPATIPDIYRGYVVLLAAIGPICGFIGSLLFGSAVFWIVTVRLPVGVLISRAVVSYALSLVMVYVLALIVDVLAPNFQGAANRV